MSTVSAPIASVSELVRQVEGLRADLVRLHDERAVLTNQLANALLDRRADRESRRAALNLLEDAIESRQAERRENDVRRRVEEELREANRRKDLLLATLQERERALQDAGARQALLLLLSDVIRLLPDPRAIMRSAAELLGRHLGDATVECLLLDDDAQTLETAAVFRDGCSWPGEEGARQPLAERPELAAAVQSGEDAFAVDPDEAVARSILVLKRAEKVQALMTATQRGRCVWDDADRHIQREVAERMWSGAERALVEIALRESNAERARLLVAAHAAQEEAERANRAKDEFLATLSHELRTPLAAILLWGGAIKSGAVRPGDLPMAVQSIVDSAKGQSRLIEDLLDLSRLSSGHFTLARTVSSVAEIIRAAVVVVRPLAAAKRIHLDLDVPLDLGLAFVDSGRVQQVLWNLLTNAIKFTDEGGRVTLHASPAEERFAITIADTGEGIAPGFLPHLFERFRQAEMNDTRRHAGLGIGLALCRSIVDLHGGTIGAASEGLGRGSRFVVDLPRGTVETAPDCSPDDRTEVVIRLDDVRVLLVEDDERTREAMRRNLEQLGAEVVAMRSGAEALAMLADETTDAEGARVAVLLCEIGLPEMNGYDLMRELGARCEAKGTTLLPACAVSGHAREVDRHRAIEAGFDFHLAKPVTRERLVAAVDDLRAIARARSA